MRWSDGALTVSLRCCDTVSPGVQSADPKAALVVVGGAASAASYGCCGETEITLAARYRSRFACYPATAVVIRCSLPSS